MKASNSVTALILAGGQSSRMGEDKGLILIHCQPLLQRVYTVAAICCSSVYILTSWPERYRAILPPDCQFLRDSQPGQGPLLAFAEAMTTLETDWVLLLACDLPQLDPQILQQWITQLETTAPSTLAVIPYQPPHWQPLCGFYRRQSHPSLQTFIQQGGRSFQHWLNQIDVHPIPVDETIAAMLFNCNTPKDVERINNSSTSLVG